MSQMTILFVVRSLQEPPSVCHGFDRVLANQSYWAASCATVTAGGDRDTVAKLIPALYRAKDA